MLSSLALRAGRFDLDQAGGSTSQGHLPLQPGWAYFLDAEVAFEPIYRVDMVQQQRIAGWNFRVISSSVSTMRLDWFARQQVMLHCLSNTVIHITIVWYVGTLDEADWVGCPAQVRDSRAVQPTVPNVSKRVNTPV